MKTITLTRNLCKTKKSRDRDSIKKGNENDPIEVKLKTAEVKTELSWTISKAD